MYYRMLVVALALVAWPLTSHAEVYSDIVFPVDGAVSFQDDFGDPRSGGRSHEGTDILADKHTPVLATVDGRIGFAPMDQPSYGWIINLEGDDGYRYVYIHLNNDNIGTDDGAADRSLGIAEGIQRGARVTAGQVIGWVGDSGNAEETVPHLHFELRKDGEALNAFDTLVAAFGAQSYDPSIEREAASTISSDKILETTAENPACAEDALVKSPESDAVYYCGRDGKRYAFPNSKIYFSWYDDFADVETISVEALAAIPFGGVVTYRPGVRMVKLQSDPKVYAVARNGVLRWVPDQDVAADIFGSNWASQIDDLPVSFFPAYDIGEPVTRGSL